MSTTKWTLDPTHSEIQFKVKHLMITTVTGSFKQFEGTIETQGTDFTKSKINFSADVDSIFTNNDQRDAHLRNGDFFDSENHPKISFVSERMEKIDDDNYKLYGTLTMRGTSRKEVLDVEYGGLVQDPWGNIRSGFTVTGKINRTEYGVSFGAVAEAGRIMLSDDVRIIAQAQFVKEAVEEEVLA